MKTKTGLVLLLAFFATMQLTAQITVRKAAPTTDEAEAAPPIPPYDSLTNYISFTDFRKYIGQQIYVLPASKMYPDNYPGYYGFSYEKESNTKKGYAELSGKYFTIADVVMHPPNSYSSSLFIKIKHKEGWSMYYCVGRSEYDSKNQTYPFVIVGYMDKLKQLYLNQTFVATKAPEDAHDLNTGKQLYWAPGAKFTCVDVTILETATEKLDVLALVFKDSAAHEISVGMNGRNKGLAAGFSDFKSEQQVKQEKLAQIEAEKARVAEEKNRIAEEKAEQARLKKAREAQAAQATKNAAASAEAKKIRRDNLIKKYGERQGNIIADGKVEIGMTQEMCIDAWGKPSDINRTTGRYGTHEQWVYNLKSYLYFDDGKLTSIQN